VAEVFPDGLIPPPFLLHHLQLHLSECRLEGRLFLQLLLLEHQVQLEFALVMLLLAHLD
jgi:hypothetical protein